ncbi:TolC family protein [Aliidiomarina sedimenti]|uniref:TolC family protein n=1 Tax=Aliidiomarina sedimenti TaxID=1933879 RepID=A0ABY0BVK6_9GAMM|nr:TolC family protein [Aliidiomarina sedimenti]RUO28147.1 TolC family protein [Aliidiomarina sedimenti]
MSFFTRTARLTLAVATLTLAACASYSPNYEALDQQVRAESAPLPVDANIAELIRYAQRHHPAVRAAEARLERARAGSVAAGAFADPQLSISQGLNDADYQTLGLSQEIPVFGRRGMSIEQARTAERAAQARLVEVKADLAANVVKAFSEYLYVGENQRLQGDLVQLLEQFTAVAERSYAAGSVSMPDLLRAQNALDEARSDYQNLDAMLFSQRARLNSALGRDARTEIEGDYSLIQSHREFARLPAPADELYALLKEQNPALLASRFEVESMLVGQDLADSAGLPRLMVGAEYMNTAMASDTIVGMVSVSLPIWRSNYRAQRDAAKADVETGIQQLRAAELEVQAELSMALYQWREAERNRELYGDVLVARSEQAVATTLSNYQNGNAGFTDVITSQREWLSFALAHRRALANQLAAVATIHALIPATSSETAPAATPDNKVEVDHE